MQKFGAGNTQQNSVVCEHLESVNVIKVDAVSIYSVIVELNIWKV